MASRKSRSSSTTSVILASTKFRRFSSSPEREWHWSSSTIDQQLKRRSATDIVTNSPEKIINESKPNSGSALKKFKGAIRATMLVGNRRTSDSVMFKFLDMSDDKRRGTIHGSHGINSKRRSGDTLLKDSRLVSFLSRKSEERKKRLILKFRIIARSIGYMIHLCHKVMVDNEESITYRAEMMKLTEQLAAADGGQVPCVNRIDTSYYKANKQMRMSQEGKRILSKLPKHRSEKEIQYATIALRNVKTIADYPLHIQQQFAMYGFYENYEPKRVIVKEGRPSENYYILIYGQVMFAKTDEGNMAKRLGSLYRGYYFGELGIYNGTARQSSIITEEYTELLRVSDIDFKRIFMGGDVSRNPEGDNFLTHVINLKGWPLHVLKGNNKAIMASYFQREAIMTRDSNLSEWIFIVKSGSIRVMKKLVKTKSNTSKRTGLHKKVAHTNGYSAFQANEDEFQRFNLYNSIELPPPLTTKNSTKHDVTGHRESSLTLPLMLKLQRACRPHTAHADYQSKGRSRRKLSLSWSTGYERQITLKNMSTLSTPNTQSPRVQSSRCSDESNLPAVNSSKDEGRRTILDDWDAATKHKQTELTEADLNPQFVHVQTITKGQTFGLQYILYKDQVQPSFIVISNGAECVKINRRVFEENLTYNLKTDLKKKVPPYPTDEYMQDRLVTQMNWKSYKDILINNIVKESKGHNHDRYSYKCPGIKL
ncbi:cyclic nucleotide-binding domain-containing protein 2-like isoform X1 [Mytilus galloprovincialis]|uniref:cyclic nucleotide-binding domain-containing protein 2-like isoform X1 n=2 Tax=Mytilus galloprovincialis TaxID=29158 RepID=UPI003F7C0C20